MHRLFKSHTAICPSSLMNPEELICKEIPCFISWYMAHRAIGTSLMLET